MHFWHNALQFCLIASAALPIGAASTWGVADATVSVQSKGAGVGVGLKERIPDGQPLSKPVSLGSSDTLKVDLVAQEARTPKRPHQAFLLLTDPATGLDISYPFSVRENGKSRIELTQKDLPAQFLSTPEGLDASFVIGSFGSSEAYNGAAFKLSIAREANVPLPSTEASRHRKLPEIHHIFKPNPESPPVFVTLNFVAMVLLIPFAALITLWTSIGANTKQLPMALKSAPLPHVVFVGSLVGLEGVFFLYYTSWNLFQTLPAALAVGVVTFISGSRALGEVQGRRLAGLR